MTSRSSAASHACHSGLAMLLAVALSLLLGCSARQSAAPTPARAAPTPATPSQPAHGAAVHLTAEIGYSHAQSLFHVENRDTFPWSNCQFTLNAHGTTPGYTESAGASSRSARRAAPGVQQGLRTTCPPCGPWPGRRQAGLAGRRGDQRQDPAGPERVPLLAITARRASALAMLILGPVIAPG